ncbi:MAG: 30S ribosome-binding factor RbfA [Candidatus Omnitrophota bacterium]|nr:30S ribosome-binding factor RbfA [Candidatus Omnitrophota bacterium]
MPRQDRVQEAIKKEVSLIIQSELNDPRMGFVTITEVRISQDLKYAKIFYSVLGKEEETNKTHEALKSAQGFIRKLVAERLQLRFAPEISFKEDKSGEYSVRIDEILNEIKELKPASVEPVLQTRIIKEKDTAGEPSLRKDKGVWKKKGRAG